MRQCRLLLLLVAALASGCALTPPAPDAPRASADLDSLMYARAGGAPPLTRVAAVPSADPAPPSYTLDSGDRLRVLVYGQEGLTNSYAVDAAGRITMPLIGPVPARGRTTAELSTAVAAKLRQGYLREPFVAVEVEAYRPFFILGEVTYPGQYPFVANMTVETAVAIAGGFSARALRTQVDLTRQSERGPVRMTVPVTAPVRPGDTVVVAERWF
jgi:polysaccharide export outer membrane protein